MKKEMNTNELVALFKQKPEIDYRVDYYKGLLRCLAEMADSVDVRLKNGITKERYWLLGFIPVTRSIVIDAYDKAKLQKEKYELESEIFMKKEYFERWMKRANEYEVEFDIRLKEAEECFDWMLSEATTVAKDNLRLAKEMEKYSNPDDDKRVKTEFYLYMKKEVENWYAFNKKKFVLFKKSMLSSTIERN